MALPMKPSVGRIVHFDSPDNSQRGHSQDPVPAMITRVVDDWTVDLLIMRNLDTPLGLAEVQFSDEATDGMRWFWPPRV